MFRSIFRNPMSNSFRSVTGAGGGGAPFTPDAAFFAGRPGFALDFKNAASLFQNSNGTGAVSAATDPIGYATDLSGNGHHAHYAATRTAGLPLTQRGNP